MPEAPLTNREIHLMFENIKDGIKAIREDNKKNNNSVDLRFNQTEEKIKTFRVETEDRLKTFHEDLEELKTFKVRALVVWAIVTTAATVAINKIL